MWKITSLVALGGINIIKLNTDSLMLFLCYVRAPLNRVNWIYSAIKMFSYYYYSKYIYIYIYIWKIENKLINRDMVDAEWCPKH